MPNSMMSNLKTVNSTVRTLIALAMIAFVGTGSYMGYDKYIRPGIEAEQAKQDLAELQNQFEKQNQKLEKLTSENHELVTSLTLLKVDARKANVKVMEKGVGEDGEPYMEVRFTEFDANGEPIGGAKDFTLRGDKLYLDCWTVSFKDKYVEQSDALRSASLCVFKKIYGNTDGPDNGFALDHQSKDPNAPPPIYKSPEQNKFEAQIWSDFWAFCNDGDKQDLFGIRNSQGKAVYVYGEEGKTYEVIVRASGELSFHPLESKTSE